MGWVVLVLVLILAAIVLWAYIHRQQVAAQAKADEQEIRQSIVNEERAIGQKVKDGINRAEGAASKEWDKFRSKIP